MAREMKDSGIEWIGEIPADWKVARLTDVKSKDNYAIVDGPFGSAISTSDYVDNGVPLVRIVNLGSDHLLDSNFVYITEEHASRIERSRFYKGDIVFAKTGATVGKCAINTNVESGILSSSCIKITIDNGLINKYFYYFFSTTQFNEALRLACNGTTRDTINLNPFSCLNCVIPSIFEQEHISNYLDLTCSCIDVIIEQTRASIEEYKRLKQAVITQAVTKGIRPGRKQKDSGHNWIKEIPQEWRMVRGKGLFYEVDKRSADGKEELLTVSQYTGITPRSQKNVNMFEAETLEGYKICEVGDIPANTMWLWAGAIGVSKYKGVISPSYNIYRRKSKDYDADYLDYLLRIPPLVQHYESLSTGIRASRLRLYPQDFLSIYFPVPPMNEQIEIVQYLSEKVLAMDNLIKSKEKYLEEIESYKKSLIYEYVTGKKEVPYGAVQ